MHENPELLNAAISGVISKSIERICQISGVFPNPPPLRYCCYCNKATRSSAKAENPRSGSLWVPGFSDRRKRELCAPRILVVSEGRFPFLGKPQFPCICERAPPSSSTHKTSASTLLIRVHDDDDLRV